MNLSLITSCGAVLSSKIPIGYIDIRVFAHATEDIDKVLKAVWNVLPSEAFDVVVFERSSLTGHHGNPIVVLEARIKDKSLCEAVFRKLASSLSALDKEQLGREVLRFVEKGSLFLRFDKQLAFLGEVKLSWADPIHFRIQFKKHNREEVVDICREYGLLS
jgi:RNA binding exosome subunit